MPRRREASRVRGILGSLVADRRPTAIMRTALLQLRYGRRSPRLLSVFSFLFRASAVVFTLIFPDIYGARIVLYLIYLFVVP